MGQCQAVNRAANALGDPLRRVEIGIGQYADELLSAVARHQVAGSRHHPGNCLGQGAQGVIANGMPQVVVVGLEVIDIKEDHRQRRAFPDAALPACRIDVIEAAPVGDAGKPVDGRDLVQLVALLQATLKGVQQLVETLDQLAQFVVVMVAECRLRPLAGALWVGGGDRRVHLEQRAGDEDVKHHDHQRGDGKGLEHAE